MSWLFFIGPTIKEKEIEREDAHNALHWAPAENVMTITQPRFIRPKKRAWAFVLGQSEKYSPINESTLGQEVGRGLKICPCSWIPSKSPSYIAPSIWLRLSIMFHLGLGSQSRQQAVLIFAEDLVVRRLELMSLCLPYRQCPGIVELGRCMAKRGWS